MQVDGEPWLMAPAQVNINILNALGKENDWFTLARGDNIFAFTADVGATNLQFRVYNQIIYEGV